MLQNMHLAYEVIVHGFAKIFDTISEAAKYADEQTALGYDVQIKQTALSSMD